MDKRIAKYELMLILLPDMGESKTAEELQEVREQITSVGGEILEEDLWVSVNLLTKSKSKKTATM